MRTRTALSSSLLLLGLVACMKNPESAQHSGPIHPHTGWAEWELWRDWPGESLREESNSSRWETPPTRHLPLRSLESARDVMDDFAVRISGLLIPPASGTYSFLLASEGEVMLRLDEEEFLFSSGGTARSEGIRLEKNNPVAFQLLHKGGQGPDRLSLGWIPPDGELEMPIGGNAIASLADPAEIQARNLRRVLIDSRLRTYDAERHMALHPHNPRPGEHIVRETFYTAGALLESDDPEDHAEAFRAIRAVIGLQNNYAPSSSHGNWPRVVQQPGNFNAQNIGGFIGAEIIVMLQRHPDKLSEDLHTALQEALRHAAHRSRRYNPPVTATNIVTKAIAVALIADAMLDIPEARAWGETRLRELHDHTLEAGIPSEYNSPTYNRVTLEALTLLRTYFFDDELSPLIEDLYRISWRELVLNYHPNLQLWVGNAARSYDGITHPGARLQEATEFVHFFGEVSASRLPSPLPEEFLPHLAPLTDAETRTIPVLGGGREADIIFQESPVPLVSTLYLHPAYALASFNRGDLWNQRRALTLTWGRRDHAGHLTLASPSGAQGLLAAQTTALQDKNRILLLVNFATDAGWGQHPWELYGIDREAPSRNIAGVRVRFQNQGADRLRFEIPEQMDQPVTAHADGIRLALRLVGGQFGPDALRWEQTRDGHLDLVLNENAPLNLHELESAHAAIALEVLEDDTADDWLADVRLTTDETHATLQAPGLTLRAAAAPAPYAHLQTRISDQPTPGETP
ncbi:MAG: hypothetical protein JJU29_01410 [Verrucomicrobia bacterium]|nr:hypothetical protein [Verrucomicrobiota bacterium]MCH8511980.1 hypothetical protein [Kiritimatiellia bacterium]